MRFVSCALRTREQSRKMFSLAVGRLDLSSRPAFRLELLNVYLCEVRQVFYLLFEPARSLTARRCPTSYPTQDTGLLRRAASAPGR